MKEKQDPSIPTETCQHFEVTWNRVYKGDRKGKTSKAEGNSKKCGVRKAKRGRHFQTEVVSSFQCWR